MKLSSKVLALCGLNVLGSSAFAPAPMVKSETTLFSSYNMGSNVQGDLTSEKTTSGARQIAANSERFATSAGNPVSKRQTSPVTDPRAIKNVWDTITPITVQGGSLRTWSIANPAVERVEVVMNTEGRPLNADVELWHGPDNTPQRMRVYIEDASIRRFCAVIETPRGHNAIAIRNTGHLEFPLSAGVEANADAVVGRGTANLRTITETMTKETRPKIIQGGAVHTYPFNPSVSSVQILLKTDGRPLNARIELMQGPNNNKQVMEVYTEDGRERPFCAIIETPGIGNVVRIVNTASVEFPMTVSVEPYLVEAISDMNYGSGWDFSVGSGSGWENTAKPFFLERPSW